MNADLVVMGVAGCGKSSLAAAFARAEALTLIEGDAFHSADSVDKMSRGVALTDADRAGWLERLGAELRAHPRGVVLTCSALRRAYRERLRAASPGLRFAFLEIDRHAALARVNARAGEHFFSAGLVDSQFATLESPLGEHGVLRLDATQPLAELQQQLSAWWHTQECDQPS
jgi:gluconokinase